MSVYDSDDALPPDSPPLVPFNPRSKPSPTPPPFIPRNPPVIQDSVSSTLSSNKKRKRSNRRVKTQPSQGDTVLISYMDPNRPDIARDAGRIPIDISSSESSGDSGDEMEVEGRPGLFPAMFSGGRSADDDASTRNRGPFSTRPADGYQSEALRRPSGGRHQPEQGDDLVNTAQSALEMATIGKHRDHRIQSSSGAWANTSSSDPRVTKINTNITSPRRIPSLEDRRRGSVPNISRHDPVGRSRAISDMRPPSPRGLDDSSRKSRPNNGYSAEDSLAASPLRRHTISHGKGSPSHKLPELVSPTSPERGDGSSATSPGNQSLPGFSQISQIAEAANHENDVRRAANGLAHRASFSSASQGPSPTIDRAGLHNGSLARSPPTPFPPLLQTGSPTSIRSDTSPSDAYLRNLPPSASSAISATSGLPFFRRGSQASEAGPSPLFGGLSPASATVPTPSSSTADSYGSSDTFSPASAREVEKNPNRMSIDGINGLGSPPGPGHPVLPLPPGMPPPSGVAGGPVGGGSTLPNVAGGFRCDHPGCTAAPFQTQYLLNSHANVHSSNRPHYCPVPGCARGEGGKGFKRKNEMIRHGLVHDSPGYVCPFCPDREHRYPRPDNLQRHVRVHHVDKDKDDPLLREVLAQRPEGGNRGRRRRMGQQ